MSDSGSDSASNPALLSSLAPRRRGAFGWLKMVGHASFRFTRAVAVLGPIYASYLWIWLIHVYFRHPVDHTAMEALHDRNARQFYKLAVTLRGGLIKAGQMISARVDIVPRVWSRELQRLQDRVEPAPWQVIRAHLQREYGGTLETRFRSIETTATAAASFGQVHRAVTLDGRQVALKVRYPDIVERLYVDLTLLRIATPLFNVFVPKVNLLAPYLEMRAAMVRELDYLQEADFTRRIGKNLASMEGVVVPDVIDEHSTGSVICTEFFEGHKLTDEAALRETGVSPRALLDLVLQAWTRMIYEDGLFQSDPHPGNLLFRVEAGRPVVCILDFGQVKDLPKDFHEKLTRAALAFMSKNAEGVQQSLVDLGILAEADAKKARPFLDDFFSNYFHLTPAQARALDVEDLRRDIKGLLNRIEGVTIPNDIVLHGRAISLLAGLASALDDSVNLFVLAQPHIMRSMLKAQTKAAMARAASAAA